MNALDASSTRPYLIRALYEWCTDNGLTPYVAVTVDDTVKVPREYVKNNEIVLNISFDATSSLQLGNEFIEFKGRFSGTARDIRVPITHVLAIYARENGQGMAFPVGPAPGGLVLGSTPASLGGAASSTPTDPVIAEPATSKFMQLVPDAASSDENAGSETDPTEPPTPPRSRPALKRVK